MSDTDFWAISSTENYSEKGYYLVKWASDSYTFQSSHKILVDVIKAGYLLCDTLYLIPFSNFK